MRKLPFSVDAALLRELGERLVGQPHIALAELIKNAYDADATKVVVAIEDDRIEVSDNGHGMDAADFEAYWMRIGSPHKAGRTASPVLERPLTGSKGVGRLSAQFLADELELVTCAGGGESTLAALVNWEEAINSRDLTSATALVDDDAPPETFPDGSKTGTRLSLEGLRQTWDADRLANLARELWPLQPPFGRSAEKAEAFQVELRTDDLLGAAEFEFQMTAVLRLWEARITGSLARTASETDPALRNPVDLSIEGSSSRDTATGKSLPRPLRHVHVVVEFDDGEREPLDLELPLGHLDQIEFEIRVFRLANRQRFGISVDEARRYFRRFGGVHLYDASFHLPYYGPDTDWLGIEQDHSHRLSRSELLPKELQVDRGLNFLPTNSRIYGVVTVNTGRELRQALAEGRDARDVLSIGIGRDRLINNGAYQELVTAVRTAMDFYAMRTAARTLKKEDLGVAAGHLLSAEAVSLERAIDEVSHELSESSRQRLQDAVQNVGQAAETEAQRIARQAGLLGALATAGIAAVAYEHEAARQLHELDRLARRLRTLGPEGESAAKSLESWAARARSTRALFTPLLDQENRENVRSLRAKAVLEQVHDQTRPLLRGLDVDLRAVDEQLRLPEGRFVEWSALWQNVFINAANACRDSSRKDLRAESRERGRTTSIRVLDTGAGIDLSRAERFFEPFERDIPISSSRGLGTGGTGLGLTIVRMIARNLRCEVAFVPPPGPPWTTAFELSWRRQ